MGTGKAGCGHHRGGPVCTNGKLPANQSPGRPCSHHSGSTGSCHFHQAFGPGCQLQTSHAFVLGQVSSVFSYGFPSDAGALVSSPVRVSAPSCVLSPFLRHPPCMGPPTPCSPTHLLLPKFPLHFGVPLLGSPPSHSSPEGPSPSHVCGPTLLVPPLSGSILCLPHMANPIPQGLQPQSSPLFQGPQGSLFLSSWETDSLLVSSQALAAASLVEMATLWALCSHPHRCTSWLSHPDCEWAKFSMPQVQL